MCRGIGQWIDDLHLLDDRAGPSVRDDERQRIFVLRTHVNEVNVQPIDLGDELRQGVQSRLALAPVVLRRPIARELLHRRELHALRCIRDRFPFRPPGRVDAPAQFGEFRFRNIHLKRTNGGVVGGLVCLKAHGNLLSNLCCGNPIQSNGVMPDSTLARRHHLKADSSREGTTITAKTMFRFALQRDGVSRSERLDEGIDDESDSHVVCPVPGGRPLPFCTRTWGEIGTSLWLG